MDRRALKGERFTLVMLTAMSGHGILFSTAALRHRGVTDREPDPPGGFFTRMPDAATLSGMAHEYAEYRLRQRVSMQTSREEQLNAFRTYANRAAALGITSVQAMMIEMVLTALETSEPFSPHEPSSRRRAVGTRSRREIR